jgi:hypothetical protein
MDQQQLCKIIELLTSKEAKLFVLVDDLLV